MKRTVRRPARMVTTGVVAVGAALTLSGCVLASPAVITTPYPASDGSNGAITDPATNATIKLDNFLVVSAGKGQPGNLVGAVANQGSGQVTVQLSVTTGDTGSTSLADASVSASPGQLAQVGPGGTVLTIPSVPQPPGSVLTLTARTGGGGSVHFTVPVMAATQQYATLTPTATPTLSPAPAVSPSRGTAKPSASASPSTS